MARDYYADLSRAISALPPGADDARYEIYNRMRRSVAQLRPGAVWSSLQISTEAAAVEDAIRRIEQDMFAGGRRIAEPRDESRRKMDRPQSRPAPDGFAHGEALVQPMQTKSAMALAALALATMLVIFAAIYLSLDRSAVAPGGSGTGAPAVTGVSQPATDRPSAIADDLDPGVDGGSSAAGLPFYLRHQTVFYRTAIVPGTIVIDRTQRFLYLVQLNNVAQRYGIGIGRDCATPIGMLRVSRKVEWPEWQASDELIRRRPGLVRHMAGGQGNPLGARALYMDAAARSIHGTNAPLTIGHLVSLGCIRLLNDDIIDLYGRVSLDARVVMKE
jgi:lipoprotein-anchoring transpeptidase ErfK/SrfK